MNNILQCFRQQTKTKKETRARELANKYYHKTRKKNDGLESGDEEKRILEKKERTGGCGGPQRYLSLGQSHKTRLALTPSFLTQPF